MKKTIDDAMAMDLLLTAVAQGKAEFRRSESGTQFSFDGFLYAVCGDWLDLVELVGWDRLAEAVGR